MGKFNVGDIVKVDDGTGSWFGEIEELAQDGLYHVRGYGSYGGLYAYPAKELHLYKTAAEARKHVIEKLERLIGTSDGWSVVYNYVNPNTGAIMATLEHIENKKECGL